MSLFSNAKITKSRFVEKSFFSRDYKLSVLRPSLEIVTNSGRLVAASR